MSVGILLSGLCAVQVAVAGGSAEILCPKQSGHAVRLVVSARQVTTWPTAEPNWWIAPDGMEYAAFEIKKIESVQFLDAQGAVVKPEKFVTQLDDLVQARHLGKSPAPGASWKFRLKIDRGSLTTEDPLVDANGKQYCFIVPDDNILVDKYFNENALWSHGGASLKVVFDGGKELVVDGRGEDFRVSLTNDVQKIPSGGPKADPMGMFGHWGHISQLSGEFQSPSQCRRVTLTSRPICNLLMLPKK